MNTFKGLGIHGALLVLLCGGLQGCNQEFSLSLSSQQQVSDNPDGGGGSAPQPKPTVFPLPQPSPTGISNVPGGIEGGHFDVDTAHRFCEFNSGKSCSTDAHVHEYDNKYSAIGADFFNLADSSLGNLNEIVTDPSRRFVLIVSNAELSPGGWLEINGSRVNVLDYQKALRQAVATGQPLLQYALGGSQSSPAQQLKSFKLGFEKDVIAKGGLIPTETGCVRANRPGAKGEYRNGALLVQALDADSFHLDPITGAASANGGLLWEATFFWHKDRTCYGGGTP
jgi:hypothetical protein